MGATGHGDCTADFDLASLLILPHLHARGPYALDEGVWRIRQGAELQQSVLGQWGPTRAIREALILRYPRSAGTRVRSIVDDNGDEPDYSRIENWGPNTLTLFGGAVLMRLSDRGATGATPLTASAAMV